ncbi:MAG: hypothetical protein FJ087_06510 [Deltaproteobacteria bacterium]|nr:hypothetical protein [Deltaproteobacteria bacterium]
MSARAAVLAIAAVIVLTAAPSPARAQQCFPCSILGRSAMLYEEKDDSRTTGIVRRQDAGDVAVCGLQGEWARVKIGYTYYWMKTEDIRLKPTDQEVLSLSLPPNVARPEAIEWCNEAVVSIPAAELYVAGQGGSGGAGEEVVNALTLRQGTLLLACSHDGDWVTVQHGESAGRMERSSLVISTADRPRGVGFTRKRVCKTFLWTGRVEGDQPLIRWDHNRVVRIATLPAGVEVQVSERQADWYWVRFAGEWGYLPAAGVRLVPGTREGFDPFRAVETCPGTFRKAVAGVKRDVLSSPGASEVVSTVPAGAEVFVVQQDRAWAQVLHLGRTGWIESAGLKVLPGEEALARDFDPYPADDSLLAPGLRGYRRDKVSGVVRLGVGMAASPQLEGVAATLDAGIGVGLATGTDLVASFYGIEADDLLAGGPELGVEQVVAPLGRTVVLAARASVGPHWFGGTRHAMTLGWGVWAGIDAALSRTAGIGVGYGFRGEHRMRCNSDPCPEEHAWFHSLACSLRLGF